MTHPTFGRGRKQDTGKLIVARMRALSQPGMCDDGGTLCLCVSPGG